MMKRVGLLCLCLFCALARAHNGMVHPAHPKEAHAMGEVPHPTEFEAINESYLKVAKPILQKACFDCHSHSTRFPWYHSLPLISWLLERDVQEAQRHLDFSNDFPFRSHATPVQDIQAIRDEIQDGSMPPWRYRILHSDTKLSAEERDKVIGWTRASEALLKRAAK